MGRRCSRRETLGLVSTGFTASLAGCSFGSADGARYSLMGGPTGGTTLVDLFSWDPRPGLLHVRHYTDELVAELLDSGRVATEAQPLAPYDADGTAPPAYTEHDGAYYRVRVTDVEDVSLDRWEFWFEPVERAPSDATVVETPTEGRSDLDADVVQWAVEEAIGAIVDDEDVSTAPHGQRGVVFFDPMAPDDSTLVPDPPFEYVRVEPDTEFLDEKQTLRAHADEWRVETNRYVNEAERVADSRSALTDVLSDHVDTTFGDVSGDARNIVEEISAGEGIYRERAPISEAFEQVLERLGIDDSTSGAETEASRQWHRYYEYEGAYYDATLRIRDG